MSTRISSRDDITAVLASIKQTTGVAWVYSHFKNGHSLPYIAYIGAGQHRFMANDSQYWRSDTYQVELYFREKDPALEAAIEDEIIAGGWTFDKSDDAYLDDEGIYLVYYFLA